MATRRVPGLARAYAVLSALALAGCAQHEPAPADVPAGTLTTAGQSSGLDGLRREFRESYGVARTAVNEQLDPLIVVRFDDVYLVRAGAVVAQDKGVPARYHALSRVSHVPLIIFLRLRPSFGAALDPAAVTELGELRAALDDAERALGEHDFAPDELAAQREVIGASRELIGSIRAGAVVSDAAFQAYRTRVHAPMMALSDAAGAAQVDTLHELMGSWRDKFTSDQWRDARVMIIGPRQPRNACVATQYFSSLFPAAPNTMFPGESERVFYVESVSIDGADSAFANERKLVATMILDADASAAFFQNRHRMSIDVMADGAARRIGSLDFSGLR